MALLFAGQGAQAVGMGRDLYERYPEVRALYERASARSGLDLARVSFEGPEEELTRTDVSQPAIVVASLAALWVLRRRLPDLAPVACAGLSLGEYSALCAAGALDEETAIALVTERGRAMQRACEARVGAMASVLGSSTADVEAAVAEANTADEPVVVANYNAERQVVIAGTEAGVARATEVLKARGARRVLPLKVAGAYHSPLMAEAREALVDHLAAASIAAPRVPVYANVTAAPHANDPAAIRARLAEQVTAPVRFAQTLAALAARGVDTFYELGPGKVLAGLVRQAAPDATCISLLGLESFAAAGLHEPEGADPAAPPTQETDA